MFKKKIQKSKNSLLPKSSPNSSDSDNEKNPTSSNITSKKQSRIICKGLQYTQNQNYSQNQNQSKLSLPIAKDPVSGFIEKEWTRHSNISKNDKGIDKFMEERLKEFHDKINKVDKTEEDEAIISIPKEPTMKNVAEMDKLIEVLFK